MPSSAISHGGCEETHEGRGLGVEAELQDFGMRQVLAMRQDDWISRHARLQDLLGSENKWVRAIGRYVT